MLKQMILLTCLCLYASMVYSLPQLEVGEDEFAASEHAETVGNILKKLPSILKKTAAWINGLGDIGDEVHPEVGDAIRSGASAVEDAADNVPDNIHTQVQEHLTKLINITKVVKENVNVTLSKIPEIKEGIEGVPGDDYILDVIESIPAPDYVDQQLQEAINYFEPLAEAIGAQGGESSDN